MSERHTSPRRHGDTEDARRTATAGRGVTAPTTARPTIVCLCGSTRFWREFQRAQMRETLAGKIVLSITCATGTDNEHFRHLSPEEWCRVKAGLDELHLRKIELADEVVILNVDGYIGESTAAELAHAQKMGKSVCFLEPRLAGREAPA